ncbi:hypothetical protein [Terracidiphilus gabretensis]|uniref:hypothetical protein n=1 Tax=Terracidiphilus gabretensis TaxID=1577687 RepID=UPI00071BAC7C|nr:hypothetical protein [Terracidiphilus gabretensis]
MQDWIEKAKQEDKEAREREEKRLADLNLKRQLIGEQVPTLFAAVKDAVKTDVERFNKHFPAYNEKLNDLVDIGAKKFEIRRAYSPSFRLSVELLDGPPLIRYLVETPNIVDGKIYQSHYGDISFNLNSTSGVVSLVRNGDALTPEGLSEEMLKPALVSFKG